jgi:hypothetical protein
MQSKIFTDGGAVSGKDYQIKKPDGTYFYLKMSTGAPAWSTSADMGYQYTKNEAERIKSMLENQGAIGLSIVKYDKDWWKNAPDDFAKGGSIKKVKGGLKGLMPEQINYKGQIIWYMWDSFIIGELPYSIMTYPNNPHFSTLDLAKQFIDSKEGSYAKGGKIKKKYAVLRSPMGEIIADIEVDNEDKNEALKKFRDMGINEVGTIYFTDTPPYYYDFGGSVTGAKRLKGGINSLLPEKIDYKGYVILKNNDYSILGGLPYTVRVAPFPEFITLKQAQDYIDSLIIQKSKGGVIGDAARVKSKNKTGIIMKILKPDDFEQFSDVKREKQYVLRFVDGTQDTFSKSELEIFKN